ncbi:MAG TPA: tRNA (adenosine(37)-N6)-threonylcarbamoyltransferase complex ATPase subunit type 1 TsaE [Candidatus Saccharimonadales bacterium]|nr:tRNA (adenosine(37)-N6)-threonylcarbamoyltransferase complex ATPase subunit type 1 TsaE [Candidatus Saccharimonadales bacterium]
MERAITSDVAMQAFGYKLGRLLHGGEVIELVGDLGAGKTTLVRGIADGLEIDEDVQSPSFTLSRHYEGRDGINLHHYDFYRLDDPGVVAGELAESAQDPKVVTIIEWAETVDFALPRTRMIISLGHLADENHRQLKLDLPASYQHLNSLVLK